jgi:PKD repeat protein
MGEKITKTVLAIIIASLLISLVPTAFIGVNGQLGDPEAWKAEYDGGDEDVAMGVAVDSDDNAIVTGYSTINSDLYFYTIKYNSENGNELRHATYKPGDYGGSAMAVANDRYDNIFVAGVKYTALGTCDCCIVKYDKNLNERWTRTYSYHDGIKPRMLNVPFGIAVDSSGNVIVTGLTATWRELPSPEYKCDYWTLKLKGGDGDKTWENISDGGEINMASGVAVDSNNNVIVTGISSDGSTSNYCTIKYDKDGHKIGSDLIYDSGGSDMASGVAVDSHDNIIVTGSSGGNYCTIKYDKNGNKLWNKPVIYNSGGKDDATAIDVDSDDNIIVTGTSKGGYYTIKYDSSGNKIWDAECPDGDEASGVVVDRDGNIIVTGSSYGENSDYLTVKYTDTVGPLTARFDYSQPQPLTIKFTDRSYGGKRPYTYSWDFGDGNTSDKPNPTHQYAAVGTYTVRLTVEDQNGDTDTTDPKDVTVQNTPPIAKFSWNPPNPVVGHDVTFNASASYDPDPDGNIVKYEWDFGDGGKGSDKYTTHRYSSPKTYEVNLTVTDDKEATDSCTGWVTVNAGEGAPIPDFTWSPSNPKVGQEITFNASASNDTNGYIVKYEWDWNNDGEYEESHETPIAYHSFIIKDVNKSEENKYVTLRVTDNESLSNTHTEKIRIERCPLSANFSYSPKDPTTDDVIDFTAQSIGGKPPYKYKWDFGDGHHSDYSNETISSHRYNKGKTYEVTLTVMDSNGDTNSTFIPIKVTEKTPGFKALPVVAAIAIAMILLRKKRK